MNIDLTKIVNSLVLAALVGVGSLVIATAKATDEKLSKHDIDIAVAKQQILDIKTTLEKVDHTTLDTNRSVNQLLITQSKQSEIPQQPRNIGATR